VLPKKPMLASPADVPVLRSLNMPAPDWLARMSRARSGLAVPIPTEPLTLSFPPSAQVPAHIDVARLIQHKLDAVDNRS
jgi:hypothetical protein